MNQKEEHTGTVELGDGWFAKRLAEKAGAFVLHHPQGFMDDFGPHGPVDALKALIASEAKWNAVVRWYRKHDAPKEVLHGGTADTCALCHVYNHGLCRRPSGENCPISMTEGIGCSGTPYYAYVGAVQDGNVELALAHALRERDFIRHLIVKTELERKLDKADRRESLLESRKEWIHTLYESIRDLKDQVEQLRVDRTTYKEHAQSMRAKFDSAMERNVSHVSENQFLRNRLAEAKGLLDESREENREWERRTNEALLKVDECSRELDAAEDRYAMLHQELVENDVRLAKARIVIQNLVDAFGHMMDVRGWSRQARDNALDWLEND